MFRTKSGFLFDGWAENADGSGTIYKVGDEIHLDRDLVLYAQWRELPAGQQYVLSESLKPGKQYIMVWNSDIADNSGKKYAMTANGTELGTTLLSDENFVTDNMLILPDEADTSPYTWDVIWNQGRKSCTGLPFTESSHEGVSLPCFSYIGACRRSYRYRSRNRTGRSQ